MARMTDVEDLVRQGYRVRFEMKKGRCWWVAAKEDREKQGKLTGSTGVVKSIKVMLTIGNSIVVEEGQDSCDVGYFYAHIYPPEEAKFPGIICTSLEDSPRKAIKEVCNAAWPTEDKIHRLSEDCVSAVVEITGGGKGG